MGNCTSSTSDKMSTKEEDKPRSILKRPGQKSAPKDFQYDEQNVLETFHPANKDYGHMKIDEAKTPYHDPNAPVESAPLSESDFADRLAASGSLPKCLVETDSDEDLTPEKKKKKADFKSKRNQHYNMKAAMLQARKMMEEEDEE